MVLEVISRKVLQNTKKSICKINCKNHIIYSINSSQMVNLPTELLRSYLAVIDFGGFTRAGEVIGRSQPAVSLQIKRLEKMVGYSLLRRSDRRLLPTEEGELLLRYARQILQLNDEVVKQLIRPEVSGRVRLGIPNEFIKIIN